MEDFEANCCQFPDDTIEAQTCDTGIYIEIHDAIAPFSSLILDDDDANRLYEWLGKALGK